MQVVVSDTYEGNKLKSCNGWENIPTRANNESCFSALPGGLYALGGFTQDTQFDKLGFWWSSTEKNLNYAWDMNMGYHFSYGGNADARKDIGCCVRCLMNK